MGNGHGQFTYTNRENLNRRVGQSGWLVLLSLYYVNPSTRTFQQCGQV